MKLESSEIIASQKQSVQKRIFEHENRLRLIRGLEEDQILVSVASIRDLGKERSLLEHKLKTAQLSHTQEKDKFDDLLFEKDAYTRLVLN